MSIFKRISKQERIRQIDEKLEALGYEKQFESNTIIKYTFFNDDFTPRFVLILSRKQRAEESMISLREFLPDGNCRFLTRIRANIAELASQRIMATFTND